MKTLRLLISYFNAFGCLMAAMALANRGESLAAIFAIVGASGYVFAVYLHLEQDRAK
jgi:hypothetical protein